VKDYQKAGLDKKIVDPDGGIHLQRLRLEREIRSQQTSSSRSKRVEWPSEGWTLSLENMPNFQHCYLFAHLAGEMDCNSSKVRRGAFKSKREGYALYKAGHVQKVQFNHTSDEEYCFFDSRVKASMTRNKLYRTKVCLSKQTAQVKSANCNCKAGANGLCKHVGALLYKLLDFTESEVDKIPPDLTCTEKPQQWHKPRSNSTNTGPYLLDELLIIKHDYDADKKKTKLTFDLKEKSKNKVTMLPHPLQEMSLNNKSKNFVKT